MRGSCIKKARKPVAFIFEDHNPGGAAVILKDDSKREGEPANLFNLHGNSSQTLMTEMPKTHSSQTDLCGAGLTPSSSGSKRRATPAFNDNENVHPNECHNNQDASSKKSAQKCTSIKSSNSLAKRDDHDVPLAGARIRTALNSTDTDTAHQDSRLNASIRRSNRTRKPIERCGFGETALESDAIWSDASGARSSIFSVGSEQSTKSEMAEDNESNSDTRRRSIPSTISDLSCHTPSTPLLDACTPRSPCSAGEERLASKTKEKEEAAAPGKVLVVAIVHDLSQETEGKSHRHGDMDIRSYFTSTSTSASTSTSTTTIQNAKEKRILQTTEEDCLESAQQHISSAQEFCVLDTSALILGFVRDGNVSDHDMHLHTWEKGSSLCGTSDAALLSHSARRAAAAIQYVEETVEFYRMQSVGPPVLNESSKSKCRGSTKETHAGERDPAEALMIAASAIIRDKVSTASLENQICIAALRALSPLSETLGRISRLAREDYTSGRGRELESAAKVTFNAADGSSISPSKDRLPCSWENVWAHAEEFRNLLAEIRALVDACFLRPKPASEKSESQQCSSQRIALAALLIAAISFRDSKGPLALKVLPLSAKARAEAKYLGSALFDEIATQIALCSAPNCANMHLSIYAGASNLSSPTSRPAVSELRRRAHWMAASVARFQLRYIFDAEPFQISTPGLAGPVNFSKSRSGLHTTVRLCSCGPRRMRQLCIPPQEFKNSAQIKLFDGATICRDTVLAALPRTFDVDPSQVSLSTLVIRALRQLVSAARDIRVMSEGEVALSLTASSLSQALNLEKEARLVGLDKDVIQIALAAEYARRFLCDISLIPGTKNFTTQTAKFAAQNVWSVLAQCAAAVKELASAEDNFILLFTDGWDAYQERIREPLISSEFIAECQTLFHEHLRLDTIDILNEKELAVAQSPDASSGESLDPRYFRLVSTDVIFDFPRLRLNQSGNE